MSVTGRRVESARGLLPALDAEQGDAADPGCKPILADMSARFEQGVNSMDTMERYKIRNSIKDVIGILDSSPIHLDLIPETTIVQLTNRVPIAHLAIERGLKALIADVGGTTGRIHSLNRLYRDLRKYDNDSADFLAEAFEDAVSFFGYNVNAKGFGHFRSLDDYLSKAGTEKAFDALRYWAIGESPKGENPIPYISPPIHRELLHSAWCLFFPDRRETVSRRVERTVAHAMFNGRRISYGSDDTNKEQSVRWYKDWLLKEHTTRCSALEEAVRQKFVIKDEQFVVQTLTDAYKDLQLSKDPAVQYYISTLNYLPEGSQWRNPDAAPEVQWFNQDQTSGMVVTPAGTCLGFVEKYADGAWGITPSEDVPAVARTARALRDAKAYLVNGLTKQVTVTFNGESRQLRMVGNKDFFLEAAWTSDTGTSIDTRVATYRIELWDADHGLLPGEEVSMELQSEVGNKFVSVLSGKVTAVTEQEVSISGTVIFRSRS